VPAPSPTSHLDDDTFDAFTDGRPVEELPDGLGPDGRRGRRRRAGARTPLPLLPFILLVAVIGIAYVGQSAHLTQATYQATRLAAEQAALREESTRLGAELDRLRSGSRIDAAALSLGLRPPSRWAYVTAVPAPVDVPAEPSPLDRPPGGDAVQRLVAALRGSFGTDEAEAAAP
jgi:Bacteriodetes cell division protein (FtsL-like)